jgi:hypothetical protein
LARASQSLAVMQRFLLPIAAVFACSCAGLTAVTVAPGHAAVALSPTGELRVLDEGVTEVEADARVDDFDLREQELGGTFTAITRDGVRVVVVNPGVVYHLVGSELLAADRHVPPSGWRPLIASIVQSTVARVLSRYTLRELDANAIRQAQETITTQAAAQLRSFHVALSTVELKGIAPRMPALAAATTETSVWEQRALAAPSRIEIARQRAESLRAEGNGIAASNRAVAATLDRVVLSRTTAENWERLLAAPSTEVVVANSPSVEVSP